ALRRATFKQGPQGTSLVLGPDHIPFTRAVGKDSGMQQQASPRRGDKNYGEQAAPAKVSRQSRWGNRVVTDSESARRSKEQPDDGESSRGGRAEGMRQSGLARIAGLVTGAQGMAAARTTNMTGHLDAA
ncbi:unnamed protein product, partial [Ectocarpus sp. 12 AP-2014]